MQPRLQGGKAVHGVVTKLGNLRHVIAFEISCQCVDEGCDGKFAIIRHVGLAPSRKAFVSLHFDQHKSLAEGPVAVGDMGGNNIGFNFCDLHNS